jgi:23S rRNA U2552 (ribose-2'-O)-methylase RlmE/FtsJ
MYKQDNIDAIIASNTGLISHILKENPLEKIVPFNLWFKDPKYIIECKTQNKQNIRIRYWGSVMLTPIIFNKGNPEQKIRPFIGSMPLYQPYHPELFFPVWEIMQHKLIYNSVLAWIIPENMGGIESIMIHHELNHCSLSSPSFNYYCSSQDAWLHQTFLVNYLADYVKTEYDLVYYDILPKINSIDNWSNRDVDMQLLFDNLMKAIRSVKKNGSLIIKLSWYMGPGWLKILDRLGKYFDNYQIIIPAIMNNADPRVWILCTVRKNKSVPGAQLRELWDIKFDEWCKGINKPSIEQWYQQNNLIKICSVRRYDGENIHRHPWKNSCKTIVVKDSKTDEIVDSQFYAELCRLRGLLNYNKRVMDTRPSTVFTDKSERDPLMTTIEQVSRAYDYSFILKKKIRNDYGGQMVTNAWFKMYELLNMFSDIIPENICSFHLCEAPGAFISATNHYQSNKNRPLKWFAQTLLPDDHGLAKVALSDQYGLMSKFPDNWLYGVNQTGDIADADNIASYISDPRLNNINFMTSDAGIYCPPNRYNDQEIILSKVNMGQIVCILAVLQQGGTAIFKTFLPMTELLTISLMYIFSSRFKKVEIVKPHSSNDSNSEVYIVASGYYGTPPNVINKLLVLLKDPDVNHNTMISGVKDALFRKHYLLTIKTMIESQIINLQGIYYRYYYPYDKKTNFHRSCLDWTNTYPINKLNKEYSLGNF